MRTSQTCRQTDCTDRLAEAVLMYRRALAIDEKSYGPDHARVATSLNNLVRLLEAAFGSQRKLRFRNSRSGQHVRFFRIATRVAGAFVRSRMITR
jgi:hypothetical protein